jgi:hypothetical protein
MRKLLAALTVCALAWCIGASAATAGPVVIAAKAAIRA